MLFGQTKEKKLEDYIVEFLNSGSKTGPSLLESVGHAAGSKETFYRVLRHLVATEVVTKHKDTYELNRHWLQRMHRFASRHIEESKNTDSDHILNFKEGEKITYRFKNPNSMGIYWAHTYDIIFGKHDPQIPILIFHPHEWLIHTRPAAELIFLSRFDIDKKLVFFGIGGTTKLDKKFKNEYESNYRQIGIGINYGLGKNQYINVLGDFIFRVTTSDKFSNEMNAFFEKYDEVTKENIKELEDICSQNTPIKMVFMRSKKEASKWRAKFKRHFYYQHR